MLAQCYLSYTKKLFDLHFNNCLKYSNGLKLFQPLVSIQNLKRWNISSCLALITKAQSRNPNEFTLLLNLTTFKLLI